MLNQILNTVRRISLFLTESWSTLLLGAGLIAAYIFKRRGEKIRELENKIKGQEFKDNVKAIEKIINERKKGAVDADKILKDKINNYDESYKQYIESRRRLAESYNRGTDKPKHPVPEKPEQLQGPTEGNKETVDGDPAGPRPRGSHNFDL